MTLLQIEVLFQGLEEIPWDSQARERFHFTPDEIEDLTDGRILWRGEQENG